MTVVGGEVVHASDEFSPYNPPLPSVSPDWSPIKYYGTYGQHKTLIYDDHQHLFTCPVQQNAYPHTSNQHFGCFCWAF